MRVDGARGEGGGQVARVALALAAATRREVTVENVRAARDPPGLKAGHVAAVRAIAEICDGEVEGAEMGSTRVSLRPGVTVGGERAFAIETAGPVTLLLQALLPAVVASRQPFALHLRGGTNVLWAPSWDDAANVHFPLLARLGIDAQGTLHRRGFFPQGGGEVTVEVAAPGLRGATLDEPGALRALEATVASHGLPRHVVERARISLVDGLREVGTVAVEEDVHRGPGTGFGVSVRAVCDHTVLGADAVGRKGVRVEDVVGQAVAGLRAELASGAAVDVHQADQLPVFLALGGGGSFTTRALSSHAKTVLGLLPEFLPVRAEASRDGARTRVVVSRA